MNKIGCFLLFGLLLTNCSLNLGNDQQKDNTVRHSAVDIKKDTREFVDLGLPSGIKWATCNIGASVPEMGGYHFAFGEVSPRTEFENDMYFVKRDDFGTDNDPLLPFINDSLEIGLSGNKKYDVVRVNWGDSYRLPTLKDFRELKAYCEANWTEKNGVTGCEFTNKETGKSIFLPAVRSKRIRRVICFGERQMIFAITCLELLKALIQELFLCVLNWKIMKMSAKFFVAQHQAVEVSVL